jgi:hypothetical protein
MSSAQHPLLGQPPDPAERGRRRQSDLCGELLVGEPRVVLQRPDQREIDSVERHPDLLPPNDIRWTR